MSETEIMLQKRGTYSSKLLGYTAAEAVRREIDDAASGSFGAVESDRARVDALADIVGRMLEFMAKQRGGPTPDELADIVGYGWSAKAEGR